MEDQQFIEQLIEHGKEMDPLKPITLLGSTPKAPQREVTQMALSWSSLQIKYSDLICMSISFLQNTRTDTHISSQAIR